MRGSTAAEIRNFNTGFPTPSPAALAEGARVAAATKSAAGTGQTVQLPYGTGSSTMHRPGTRENDVVTTATGVQRLTDLQQVARDNPRIATAGTPENEAFVANRNANPSGDARQLAASVTLNDGGWKPSIGTKPMQWATTGPAPSGTLAGYTGSVNGNIPAPAVAPAPSGAVAAGQATGKAIKSGFSWLGDNVIGPIYDVTQSKPANFVAGALGAKSNIVPEYGKEVSPQGRPMTKDWTTPSTPLATDPASLAVKPRKKAQLSVPADQYGA